MNKHYVTQTIKELTEHRDKIDSAIGILTSLSYGKKVKPSGAQGFARTHNRSEGYKTKADFIIEHLRGKGGEDDIDNVVDVVGGSRNAILQVIYKSSGRLKAILVKELGSRGTGKVKTVKLIDHD